MHPGKRRADRQRGDAHPPFAAGTVERCARAVIHRLSGAVLALLAEAIGHGEIPASNGQRLDRSRVVPLPDIFTVIGMTDAPGKLAPSLGTRFLTLSLAPYSRTELKVIVVNIARQQGRDVTPQAARVIAEAAEGSPRLASVLLDTIALAPGHARITEAVVRTELERAGIDILGLWDRHRVYLRALADADDVGLGLEALLIRTGFDASYIRREIEPQLLAKRLIQLRGSSRWLSEEGELQARRLQAQESSPQTDREASEEVSRTRERPRGVAEEHRDALPVDDHV
jgi:Holliday junction resolvasome RuvABC ATP-dependent DNA helicase subunit